MILIRTIGELRAHLDAVRRDGGTVGFVPTMGAFHEGHRSLMRAARPGADCVVVSLFVNPTQFGAGEDLAAYPRDLDGDAAAAAAEGVDVLFVPAVEDMYPGEPRTTVHVAGLTDGLCGAGRPGHFDGVATVVTKLCSIVGQCRAYFGRKDAQQLAVVRRLVADLNLPVEVVGCPLVRDDDGLALSSRNAYLDAAERRSATVLHRALTRVVAAVEQGERSVERLRAAVAAEMATEPGVALEYAEIVDADELRALPVLSGSVLVALAARVGRTRLIDNATFEVSDAGVGGVDLGVSLSSVSTLPR